MPQLGARTLLPHFLGKELKMSWDDAYNQLEQELGREPNADEVQRRMLEMAQSRIQEWRYA
jgi:hypothetical protein